MPGSCERGAHATRAVRDAWASSQDERNGQMIDEKQKPWYLLLNSLRARLGGQPKARRQGEENFLFGIAVTH